MNGNEDPDLVGSALISLIRIHTREPIEKNDKILNLQLFYFKPFREAARK